MAKKIADEEDSLKRQARRRLIGAVALTTAVVVLLPMVLDSEPRQGRSEVELRIPDPENAGDFQPEIINASEVLPTPSMTTPDAPIAHSEPVAQPSPAMSGSVPPKIVTPSVQTQRTTSEKPATTQAAPVAPAKPVVKSEVRADKSSGFVVQFGAFSSAEAARKLQQNLNQQGIKAYTEKSGDKIRVRAGPYATREAADKIKRQLEGQGLHPVVSPAQ